MAKKSHFRKSSSTENSYARALRQIAREVGRIIEAYGDLDPTKLPPLRDALEKYAKLLGPWAKLKASNMLEQADRQDRRAWASATKEMAIGVRQELKATAVGERVQQLMGEQVKLIKSIPIEAAERVHRLVIKNVEEQGRAEEIAKEIRKSGKVAASRATLIARTEVARASSVLTQARAENIGSEGYIWRSVKDSDVRPSHRKMNGKFVKWSDPPTLDGLTGHAGALPNCRCFAEPVVPRDLL